MRKRKEKKRKEKKRKEKKRKEKKRKKEPNQIPRIWRQDRNRHICRCIHRLKTLEKRLGDLESVVPTILNDSMEDGARDPRSQTIAGLE
jgi:hypothetical protein